MDRTRFPSSRQATLHRRAVRLEWCTVIWNVVEALVALSTGLMAGSTALVAFGTDSLIELISAGALLRRLRRAGPNASDEEHDKAERQALTLVAVTFGLLATYVAADSLYTLLARQRPVPSTIGLALAALSLLVMPLLAYAKQRTGRELGSAALRADAVETWVCTYLSFALLAGTGLHLIFQWWWADAAGALAMLPVIVWQGRETLEEARARDAPAG